MAIIETIKNSSHFYSWLKSNDENTYKNAFSYEGANALQEYLDEMAEDIGEPIEFDPIAWCCEYSEYDTQELFNDYGYLLDLDKEYDTDEDKDALLEEIENNTILITVNSDCYVLQSF